jgi:hypothetical protein
VLEQREKIKCSKPERDSKEKFSEKQIGLSDLPHLYGLDQRQPDTFLPS